jgi:hypothetical protein
VIAVAPAADLANIAGVRAAADLEAARAVHRLLEVAAMEGPDAGQRVAVGHAVGVVEGREPALEIQVEGEGLPIEADLDVIPGFDHRVAEATVGPRPGIGLRIQGDLVAVELDHAVDHEE